jgi:ribulose kinase
MLGAVAAGVHASTGHAMDAMTRLGEIVQPDPRARSFRDRKYAVYRQMIDDQIAYRSMMGDY